MLIWFVEARNKIKEMPGPEKMMIGISLVAFIIAVVVTLWGFISGLENL
jgi:hypothetical protein